MRCSCMWCFFWCFFYMYETSLNRFSFLWCGFLWSWLGAFTVPPTVSWAVQCVLTRDHLPVSPMSNANHTDLSAVLIPPYPSCFSIHSFHLADYTAAESTGTKRNPHRWAITVTVIVVCHISAASALRYITESNFSMKTSMRQRLWFTVSAITQPVY